LADGTGRGRAYRASRVKRLANRRAEKLFRYAPGALAGRSVDTLVPDALAAAHARHRAGYHRDPRTRPMGEDLELHGRRADGTEFPIDVALGPTEVAGERLVVAIVRDITDRKLRQDELRFLSARALPAIARDLLRGKLPAPPPKQMRLRDTASMPASDGGWVLLGDEPGASIALGLVGTFWRPVIAFAQVDRGRVRDFAEPGFAKTVYELSVRELPDGRTLLTGLMRTATTDERARRMFRRYWTFGVGSGAHVLVNGVLDSAREIAERGNAGPEPVPTRVAEPDRAGVT